MSAATTENAPTIPGLPERSILFVSMVTHAAHPLHETVRRYLHPPDLDLAWYVQRIGPGLRRYFAEEVVDGTTGPLPADLSRYRGVVMGCTLHYMNPARTPIAPWQEELVRFARRVIFDYRLPFYGCCGGAQIGQVALGGRMTANPKGPGIDPGAEGSIVIRTTQLALTEVGRADPLFRFAAPTLPMHSLHSDHVAELAEGCQALAHSADIPNLAIAYGDRVRLLVGMHPELSDALLRQMAGVIIRTGRFGTQPDNQEGMTAAVSQVVPTEYANKQLLLNFLTELCVTDVLKE